jgi:serine/threonine-protein kinase
MDLEVGSTIGDYQVTGILGAGGMGKVYKVRNVISDRLEAMKVLLPDLLAMPELADRFLREIKVLAMLDHPNIAQLHTAVRANNQLLMVMEFVDGQTLEQRLRQGPLPLAQALDYVGQVLSALDFAHSRGVVHRDIKPANMMLTPAGVVKLMDFGIAKAATDHKLTMTGTTMGSVYYMSPEQIQGAATLDGRADLYSVGVTLYELSTGKRPFDGESQYSIMAAHLERAPVPPISLDPRLPQALNDVILMAVAKDPNARFQTAKAFRNALLSVAGTMQAPTGPVVNRPIAPPIASPINPSVAPAPQLTGAAPKSKRWLWMAIGGMAAVAAIAAAVEFGPWKATKAAAPYAKQAPPATAPPATAPPATAPAASPAPQDAAAAAVPAPSTAVTAPQQQPSQQPVQQPSHSAAAATPVPAPAQSAPQHSPVSMPPASMPPASMPPVSAPPVSAPAPPAPAGPSRADVLQAREHFAKLQVRAGSVHDSLANLKRTMQSQGMALNAKFTQPENLMDTYLRSAENALNQSDLAASREYADKAERQIEILEKLLNL